MELRQSSPPYQLDLPLAITTRGGQETRRVIPLRTAAATLTVDLPLTRATNDATEVILEVGYQGCAEAGICYPPMKKKLPVHLPAIGEKKAAAATGS